MVDLDCPTNTNQGATSLIRRCMRSYNWSLEQTKGILKAYRQFLTLKKDLGDLDATILSPSHLVEQMWRQHILDNGNYCHDMVLLCGGQVMLHNPDEALDQDTKKSRDSRTQTELIKKFGSEVDQEVWGFPSVSANNTDESDQEYSNDELKIFIRDPSNCQIPFTVSRKTSMCKVMKMYANHRGINRSDIQFYYHGKSVLGFDTPRRLDLEHNDTIDMVPLSGA